MSRRGNSDDESRGARCLLRPLLPNGTRAYCGPPVQGHRAGSRLLTRAGTRPLRVVEGATEVQKLVIAKAMGL
jgi:hypothetical protein